MELRISHFCAVFAGLISLALTSMVIFTTWDMQNHCFLSIRYAVQMVQAEDAAADAFATCIQDRKDCGLTQNYVHQVSVLRALFAESLPRCSSRFSLDYSHNVTIQQPKKRQKESL